MEITAKHGQPALTIVRAQAPSGTKTVDVTTVDPDAAFKAAAERMRAEAAALKGWTNRRRPWGIRTCEASGI
jgi:hypothetical protein